MHAGLLALLSTTLALYILLKLSLYILETNSIESIYLQGIRQGSEFVDDHGKLITYYQWNAGEPGSGEHLQTEKDTRLQEVSSGGTSHPVLCRFYG